MLNKLLKFKERKQINKYLNQIFQKQEGAYNLINQLNDKNLLKVYFPHIDKQKEVYQCNIVNGKHIADSRNIHLEGDTVFDHTIEVLKHTKKGCINAWCSLFHDIGKTNLNRKQTIQNTVGFSQHDTLGYKYSKKILKEFYLLEDEIIQIVSNVCKYHMKIYNVDNDFRRRKFIIEMSDKNHRNYLYNLCKADTEGTKRLDNSVYSIIDDKFI